jgi:hypothetical protein
VTRHPDLVREVAHLSGAALDASLEEWEERAAIREYLGDLDRADAEELAATDAVVVLRRRAGRLL